jgi:predicted metal-dependent hydrolase
LKPQFHSSAAAETALDARYVGFFDCFNRRHFFEAHEVLEELWLLDRRGADGDFFKGLIQLAGAFVHLQKNRPQPAVALFKLASANLQKYPATHFQLDVAAVLQLVAGWVKRLENFAVFADSDFPRLELQSGGVR